jgi:hypothetical protein
MLDIPIMGTNAPKEHQRVIAQLTHGLYDLYIKGHIKYEPLPETMVDESTTSATPDILLFDHLTGINMMMVEVTITASEKSDFGKVSEVCERYEIEEGFTYNYRTNKWRKYKLATGEITDNPSFCETIGYDLNDFLQ